MYFAPTLSRQVRIYTGPFHVYMGPTWDLFHTYMGSIPYLHGTYSMSTLGLFHIYMSTWGLFHTYVGPIPYLRGTYSIPTWDLFHTYKAPSSHPHLSMLTCTHINRTRLYAAYLIPPQPPPPAPKKGQTPVPTGIE